MELDHLSELITGWTEAQPLVRKAYVFGSRVKGTHSPNSDLDVAIELVPRPGDETVLATWICEARALRESLARVVPVPVDLEWYGGPDETPTIHTALLAGSRVVYERQPTLPVEKDVQLAARPLP